MCARQCCFICCGSRLSWLCIAGLPFRINFAMCRVCSFCVQLFSVSVLSRVYPLFAFNVFFRALSVMRIYLSICVFVCLSLGCACAYVCVCVRAPGCLYGWFVVGACLHLKRMRGRTCACVHVCK